MVDRDQLDAVLDGGVDLVGCGVQAEFREAQANRRAARDVGAPLINLRVNLIVRDDDIAQPIDAARVARLSRIFSTVTTRD